MALEFKFICPLAGGIHARPASALEEIARNFGAEITLVNERNGSAVSAKSVLAIVAAEIRHHDPCRLSASGTDADEALKVLSAFVREELPHCDDAVPAAAVATAGVEITLPTLLRESGAAFRRGTVVVNGIGCGRIARAHGLRLIAAIPEGADGGAELQKLDAALARLVAGYDEKLARSGSHLERELLQAHRSIARDPEFHAKLRGALAHGRRTVADAIAETESHFTTLFVNTGSRLLAERVPDLQDVCGELLREVYGASAVSAGLKLTQDALVVAASLTPGQFLALDRRWLKGLVLGQAGTTSHTVILARSFGIPTLTGVAETPDDELEGQEAVADAELGLLVTQLTPAARRYYDLEQRRLEQWRERQRRSGTGPARTSDGHRLEIAANIATAEEAEAAFNTGAEGIGLFRTEMLFLERGQAPDEAEQFEAYRKTLIAAAGRPVIIRTLDVGGDKPLDYLKLPPEDNPFLGYRAVRMYPEFEALFRTQARALIRASTHGLLKVMIPMITSLEEVRWVRKIIAEEQARCAAEGIAHDPAMAVGAMVEVPAAAFMLDSLARELDFFSVGSNDLLQCFAAADRTNSRLGALQDPLQPAFLRLLKKIVEDAHAAGKWVGLCGEMGGRLDCLPLLAGLGFDEISAAPPAIQGLKAELAGWTFSECSALVNGALACGSAGEVRRLLAEHTARQAPPLLDPELVIIDSDSGSKAEAIKEAVDRLFVLGRTTQPRAVEEAVWQREAVYSTGFGHGFAMPHCKTNAVMANSLVVVKLRTPIAWGSLDDQPVGVMLLLTIRESDQATAHLKILAQLARKVMHEEFRERLTGEREAAGLCAFLAESLGRSATAAGSVTP